MGTGPSTAGPRAVVAPVSVDAADHSDDYQVLPLVVRVSWRGPMGDRTVEQSFNLGDLR